VSSSHSIPRVVIAATGSGVGKTTVTVGLISALRARGLKVAAFKCGPDYLDPTYHRRAAGVVSHNLDGWMMGRDAVLSTFARASRGFDIAVIEGMMGLFDSAAPTSDKGSSGEIAKWLKAPVLLVTDASGMARSIAAMASGYAHFDREVRVAGVIANRVGSRGHLDLLREASAEVPVVGGFPEHRESTFPERHLGLRTADDESIPQALFDTWGRLAGEWLDLDAIIAIARSAPALEIRDESRPRTGPPVCRIGVAWDDAFHFYYEDNLARIESLGAEIVKFAPARDAHLPAVDGIYFGGGYPEVMARDLSSNRAMLEAIRSFAHHGGTIYAECGGLMYLAEAIRTLDGTTWPMLGLVPGVAVMAPRLQALGYVEVETRAASILGPAGTRFRGHQFRYSTLESGEGKNEIARIYRVRPRWGAEFDEGYARANVVASYVHAHWASNPAVAEALVRACAQVRRIDGP
jgi:cobyrinic acid a,c-diamide synthase